MILKTKLIYNIGGRNVVFNRKLNGDIVPRRAIEGCIGCANYQKIGGCCLKKFNIDVCLLKCGFDLYNLVNWSQYTSGGIIHYRYVAEKGLDD